MSRKNESDVDGIVYKNDPIIGKTLTLFGTLIPWLLSVFLVTPILVVGGVPFFVALNITPWVGLLASVIWIEMD